MQSGFLEEILGCTRGLSVPRKWAEIPFAEAFFPWLQRARERLKQRMTVSSARVSDEAMACLEGELLRRWSEVCSPACVLEMHIVKMQEELKGETSEERFRDYVQRFLGEETYLRTFFTEYEVMLQWVKSALELWVDKVFELLKDLESDYEGLSSRFGRGKELGVLKEIKSGLSDPHNGNRVVYELLFDSGVSVFYKPKSQKVDATFNALLQDLSSRGLKLPLKGFGVWDCGSYGWVEKVEHLPCKNIEEAQDYFTRSGMLLCLFYILGGTDLHYENLIAHGAHPVIVDLESLFQPQLRRKESDDLPEGWKETVLKVGMLPHFMMGEAGLPGVDISALGARGGQSVPSLSQRWEGVNTDEMRLVSFRPTTHEEHNSVKVGEALCNPADYQDQVVDGFAAMYALILNNKSLFLDAGGWLDRFSESFVRCICRPTRLYFKLLFQLLDPKCLSSKKEHKETLDILPRYLLENGNQHLKPVVEEELRAMAQRDIPFFQARPGGKDLYLNGKVVVSDVLAHPPLFEVRKEIEEMSEERLGEQIALIRQSFFAFAHFHAKEKTPLPAGKEIPLVPKLSDEALIEEALSIGRAIVEQGRVNRKGGMQWMGLEYLPAEEQTVLTPLSHSLYGGTLGVALFFGALYKGTGDKVWKERAQSALMPLLEYLDSEGAPRAPGALGLGGMSGVGSMIYVLGHLALLLKEPELIRRAHTIASWIEEKHLAQDSAHDVIGGSAGLILALLSVHRTSQKPALLELACRAGEYLEEKGRPSEAGVSWPMGERRALLGFSHGTAGIALALERLAEASGRGSFYALADRAIAYERSHFSKEAGNWPDFRQNPPNYEMFTWCHGAPGIGLARAYSPRFQGKGEEVFEMRCAIDGAARDLAGGLDHLCCGNLGRIEIVRTLAKKLRDASLYERALQRVAALVAHVKERGDYNFNTFIPLPSTHFIGFMQGLSGVGYTLLRCTEQGKSLPNVLVLE